MKRIFLIAFTIILMLLSNNSLKAQTIYLCTDAGNIYSLNMNSCVSTLVASSSGGLDIAMCSGNPNIIYGIGPGNLFQLDISTGITTLISSYGALFPGVQLNALVCDGNGMLYAADGFASGLYGFNLSTNTWSYLGNLNGYISGGDLTFYNGILYLATIGNQLVQVSLNPVNATFVANISVSYVFGIVTLGNGTSCNSTYTLLGTEVADNSIYVIDATNGTATLRCGNVIPAGEAIYGAASIAEGITTTPLNATITPSSITIEADSSIQLIATGGGTYSWSPTMGLSCTSCANPIASPSQTTNYCVTVTDSNGCSDTPCIKVSIDMHCPTNDNFSVPNAFSPNNDGHNDLMILHGWESCVEKFSMIIYDRWGEKVFESVNPSTIWDGTFKGKPMDSAVFVYYITATLINGEKITKKGNISLIR